MYGTIARARTKEGVTVDQLKERFDPDARPAGSLSLIVFQAENDPREVWIASAFESREAYFKNANSPEQQARFEQMQAMMEGPPEWHDGHVIVVRSDERVSAR